MTARDESEYRLRLVADQIARARRALGDPATAALLARAAVENATKAIVACFASIARSHEPGELLEEALAARDFPAALRAEAQVLRTSLAAYGARRHIELSYGDERGHRLPSEIVDEADALAAIDAAEQALGFARRVRALALGG